MKMEKARGVCLFLFMMMTACGHSSKQRKTGQADAAGFFQHFKPVSVPLQVRDSIFLQKRDPTDLITPDDVTGMIPDSVFTDDEDELAQMKFYPFGGFQTTKGAIYILLLAFNGANKTLYLAVFDRQKKLIAVMPAMSRSHETPLQQALLIEKNQTITLRSSRKNKDGSLSTGRNVYALNEGAKKFTLIMTDALDEKPVELVNPIDTLPRKFKYSADYGKDKRNLVSVRDGVKNGKFFFFIHLEKNSGECTGEMRGSALLSGPTTAVYQQPGDPCILTFTFSSSAVSVAEQNCGSHRGLNCLFEGSFGRMKEKPKPKTNLPKKNNRR